MSQLRQACEALGSWLYNKATSVYNKLVMLYAETKKLH